MAPAMLALDVKTLTEEKARLPPPGEAAHVPSTSEPCASESSVCASSCATDETLQATLILEPGVKEEPKAGAVMVSSRGGVGTSRTVNKPDLGARTAREGHCTGVNST